MAGSPKLKVFNPQNEYVACFKLAEDAAMFVGSAGEGYTIRYGHNKRATLWTEGSESQSAAESFDFVAGVVLARMADLFARNR